MDCSNARLLLRFSRRDLTPGDVSSLDAHLAGCAECSACAQAERAFDLKVGRAMKEVPVPDGLRQRLLEKLATERENRRRWFTRSLRLGAVAAALLLALLGAWAFYPGPKELLDQEEVFTYVNIHHADIGKV